MGVTVNVAGPIAVAGFVATDIPPSGHNAIHWLAWDRYSGRLATAAFPPSKGVESLNGMGAVHVLSPSNRQWTEWKSAEPALRNACLDWSYDGKALFVLGPKEVSTHDSLRGTLLGTFGAGSGRPFTMGASRIRDEVAIGYDVDGAPEVSVVSPGGSLPRRRLALPDDVASVGALGWAPGGPLLAGLLMDIDGGMVVAIWDDPNEGSRPVREWRLTSAVIEAPDLSASWSPDNQEVIIAAELEPIQRPDIPTPQQVGSEVLIPSFLRFPMKGHPSVQQIPIASGGFFGAAFSPDGSVVSCSTGTDLLFFKATDLAFVRRYDSFYSSVKPEPQLSEDGKETFSLSSLGFTRCHAWAPDGRWLAAGNFGGLRLWSTAGVW